MHLNELKALHVSEVLKQAEAAEGASPKGAEPNRPQNRPVKKPSRPSFLNLPNVPKAGPRPTKKSV